MLLVAWCIEADKSLAKVEEILIDDTLPLLKQLKNRGGQRMPYLFGGLVVLNAAALGYYLFLQPPISTETLKAAQDEITQPLAFTNSAEYIPPVIGTRE